MKQILERRSTKVIITSLLGILIAIVISALSNFGMDYINADSVKGISTITIPKITFESTPEIHLIPLTFDVSRFEKAETYIEEQKQAKIREEEEARRAAEQAAAIAARNNFIFPKTNYGGDMTQMIKDKFGVNADKAIIIAQCESGMNPNSIGDRGLVGADGYGASYGLFQIRYLRGRPSPTQLLDPTFNINYAYNMSGGGTNWSAWSCKKRL